MAAGNFIPYNAFYEQMAKQAFDFVGTTVEAILLADTYTPDVISHSVIGDVSADEIGDADYSRQPLSNKAITIGGESATLDAASATDVANGVELPSTGHPFKAGDRVTISGTTNYNGNWVIYSVTTNAFVIEASYTSETFGGSETVQQQSVLFDADDIDFGNSVSISARYMVLAANTGTSSTSYLMGYVDLNDGGTGEVSSTNSDFDISFAAQGITRIDP